MKRKWKNTLQIMIRERGFLNEKAENPKALVMGVLGVLGNITLRGTGVKADEKHQPGVYFLIPIKETRRLDRVIMGRVTPVSNQIQQTST